MDSGSWYDYHSYTVDGDYVGKTPFQYFIFYSLQESGYMLGVHL